MGSRSRKRGRTDRAPVTPATFEQAPAAAQEPAPSRSEIRNAAIRRGLEPLQPGEHPGPLLAAILFSVVIALVNVGLLIFGYEGGNPGQNVIFGVIMLVAAAGMWYQQYWAVLGFQALLALTILVSAGSIAFAGNLYALVLCVTITGFGGWLFWSLVRVLGRMKTPEYPSR